jgi:hypothetical protein
VHACQPLWHVRSNDRYHGFTCVHHTDYLGLTRMRFPGENIPHGLFPVPKHIGTLSRSLLIQTGRFTWQNRWFSPCFQGKTTLKSDFVSHANVCIHVQLGRSSRRATKREPPPKRYARGVCGNWRQRAGRIGSQRVRTSENHNDIGEGSFTRQTSCDSPLSFSL